MFIVSELIFMNIQIRLFVYFIILVKWLFLKFYLVPSIVV